MRSTLIDCVLVENANWLTRMTFFWKLNTESRNWLTKKSRRSQPFNERESRGYSATQNTLYQYLFLTDTPQYRSQNQLKI